jgi:hypothetical protein
MAVRQDSSITLPSIEQFNNKKDIRGFLLQQWIAESPHAKYRYFVETLQTGTKIYLERPDRLNKGCDFVIFGENAYLWNNGNDRPPDHGFIINDFISKRQS